MNVEKLNYIFNICPELSKIFKNSDIIDEKNDEYERNLDFLRDRLLLVKGHVQSGKTKFIISASMLCLLYNYSVVVIIRNQQADREQLYERFLDFQQKFNKQFGSQIFPLHKITKKIKKEGVKILLGLGNNASMQKIIDSTLPKKYILFVDEVDFIDSKELTKKNENLKILKENSFCTLGISATVMDPLGKDDITTKDLLLLNVSQKYKGIDKISFKLVKRTCKFSGRMKDNLFKKDECLLDFLTEFSKKTPFSVKNNEKHPNICLINICRTKEPYYRVQDYIGKNISSLVSLVYNSDGISYRKGDDCNEFMMSISACLQYLKDTGGVEKYPNIVIFSGDLASRGISFVSTDFGWHLTSMRLLVARSCNEPELIQKVRLCGVYDDNIPLELYTTKKIKNDLLLAFTRQEEILSNVKKSGDTEKNCRELIEAEPIYDKKFSSRSVVKDDKAIMKFHKVQEKIGWVYDKENFDEIPNEFYDMYGLEKENKNTKNDEKVQSIDENCKLLDKSLLSSGTLMRDMVDFTYSWFLANSDKHNKDIERSIINNKLLEYDKKFKSIYQLNGSWDSNIKMKMKSVGINSKGLLYIKKNGRYYFRFNL
jgi:hypothetical protein